MTNLWLVGLVALTVGCLEPYDPPPDVARVNIAHGLYDTTTGPLTVDWSEPVRPTSFAIGLYAARTNAEFDLCVRGIDDALPSGCTEEAVALVEPCSPHPSRSIDDGGAPGRRYRCDGGELTMSDDNRAASVVPVRGYVPYERYILHVRAGLSDQQGRVRRHAVEIPFQVKGTIPCGPTDFQSGFFFTVFDIEQPVAIQFHFVFWAEVDSATGQARLYGADYDTEDLADQRTNRNPKDWHPDPFPPSGATIVGSGQIADIEGGRVLVVYPFALSVEAPPVYAPGVEVTARVERNALPSVPGGEREVITGRLNSPAVYLGTGEDQASLGAGRGEVMMFRLNEDEAPALEHILPKDVTPNDVRAPFKTCE